MIAILIVALGASRLTRLVTKDTVFNRPRQWLLTYLPSKLREGLTCPWCVSAYMVAGLLWVDSTSWSWRPYALAWLAGWMLAVLAYFTAELVAAAAGKLVR